MTGIERLHKLIADIDVSAGPELWYILREGTEGDWDCEEQDDKTLGSTLAAIADQIEREQGGRVSRMRVLSVVTEMERHVSGVEGMEDSPVARWARELRAALGRQCRDISCDVSHIILKNWPRYESGELVNLGDDVSRHGEDFEANVIALYRDGSFSLNFWAYSKGERVKRPAPKILAADGEPLEAGQTVWDTDAETDTPLTVVEVSSDLVRCEYTWKDGKTYRPCYPPDQLTHTKPKPPKRFCRDCAHWQKDPTADNMGVCWFLYHEYEGQDCYSARLSDIGACEEFMPSARSLAERERGE